MTNDTAGIPSEPPKLFSAFEVNMAKCLGKAKGRSAHAAGNALHHLSEAWRTRESDPSMAAFRAITAEEEAAAALILLLRERHYSGARRLRFRDHLAKQAVFPFLVEVSQVLHPLWDLLKPKLHIDVASDGSHQMDVIYTIDDVEFRHRPPLGHVLHFDPVDDLPPETVLELPALLTQIDVTVTEAGAREWITREKVVAGTQSLSDMLTVRLSAKSNQAGFKSFRARVRQQTNSRNSILYSGPAGWPTRVKDVDSVIRERKRRAVIILDIFCLLFPHGKRATLVEQATVAFSRVIGELAPCGASDGGVG